jgi:hypothetical protein
MITGIIILVVALSAFLCGYELCHVKMNSDWRVRFEEEELLDVQADPDKIRWQSPGVTITKCERDDRDMVTRTFTTTIYKN